MARVETTSQFRELLRKGGYKATPSRLRVLGVLEKARKPLSAQDIIDAVAGAMDQTTVYRTLVALKGSGFVRQVDMRHNHAHFELVSKDNEHHHLICVRCGRVEDVYRCDVEDTYGAILRRAKYFNEVVQHSLEFYGTCVPCSKKER